MHDVNIINDKKAQPAETDPCLAGVETGLREQGVESLYDVFFEQAARDEAIIRRMAEAVKANDKEAVFTLAKELTCVTNDQQ